MDLYIKIASAGVLLGSILWLVIRDKVDAGVYVGFVSGALAALGVANSLN